MNPYWSTTVGGTYYLLDGYISDFCIYDQALSLGDVENAKAGQLKATQTNYDANTTQVIYKDPAPLPAMPPLRTMCTAPTCL